MSLVGDHYDIFGGAIYGIFVLFGILSVLFCKPWTKKFDKRRRTTHSELVEAKVTVKDMEDQEI